MVPRPDVVYLSLSRSLEDNLRVARKRATLDIHSARKTSPPWWAWFT